MPISSNLGVSLYTTGLLVKGRSIENDVWGHGWNLVFQLMFWEPLVCDPIGLELFNK